MSHRIQGLHHITLCMGTNLDTQDKVKAEIEGLGFTDCSDRRHRGYFQSAYVRRPPGHCLRRPTPLAQEATRLGERAGVVPLVG